MISFKKFTALAISLAFLLAPVVSTAAGGRVGDPKNLRVKRTQKERGRIMRRPPIPDPRLKQPATLRATVPDPTAKPRGGKAYNRRGRYYYEKAKPIYAGRGKQKRLMPPDPTYRKTR
ncbi:MAG: hypothetical protein P8K76_03265 [Candidatus Binatia bacterium]|jgi:hypothetical protein|nr:hypothetical protein [Candidatus Binatia bacterium]MDG2008782.1 hypothetical protein [Candidatus Binatia bacterium]HAC79201.1 hypothetical protein [Deltaproteobacteria bacterium]